MSKKATFDAADERGQRDAEGRRGTFRDNTKTQHAFKIISSFKLLFYNIFSVLGPMGLWQVELSIIKKTKQTKDKTPPHRKEGEDCEHIHLLTHFSAFEV